MGVPKKQIKEKRHRLARSEYVGIKRISFTLCVDEKRSLFTDKKLIELFADMLDVVLAKHKIRNWIYVFMPDHVHLVLEGMSSKSDLWKAVKEFKQKTGVWLSKNSKLKWQKDFYDHIHRENENMYFSLNYIMNNPVRKGLVLNCLDYMGLGSLDFDIEQMVNQIERSPKAAD